MTTISTTYLVQQHCGAVWLTVPYGTFTDQQLAMKAFGEAAKKHSRVRLVRVTEEVIGEVGTQKEANP